MTEQTKQRGLRVNEELQRRMAALRESGEAEEQPEGGEAAVEAAPARRPALREDSPRDRAAKRAAELRGHLGDIDEGTDEFYIDPESIPDGWTYEWKTFSIYNQEQGTYIMQMRREGWEPVPASRHPQMMHKGAANDPIMRKGMILMECPTEIVEERRRLQIKAARDQVRFKEAQLAGTPDGTMTRDHAKVRPSIKKGFEPIPIPE